MSRQVEMPYDLFEEVHLTAIDTDGFIDSINLTERGWTFRVCYWIEGKRYETWVYEREIKAKGGGK